MQNITSQTMGIYYNNIYRYFWNYSSETNGQTKAISASSTSPINYNSESVLSYNEFEALLSANVYLSSMVGAEVIDSNDHHWTIINVGNNFYDLFYNDPISAGRWQQPDTTQSNAYWKNCGLRTNINGSKFYDDTTKLPTDLKSHIVQKTVNAAWIKTTNGGTTYTYGGTNSSQDNVWILTYTEIHGEQYSSQTGDMNTPLQNGKGDGTALQYFLDNPIRTSNIWTSTGAWWAGNDNFSCAIAIAGGSSISNWGTESANSKCIPCIRVA